MEREKGGRIPYLRRQQEKKALERARSHGHTFFIPYPLNSDQKRDRRVMSSIINAEAFSKYMNEYQAGVDEETVKQLRELDIFCAYDESSTLLHLNVPKHLHSHLKNYDEDNISRSIEGRDVVYKLEEGTSLNMGILKKLLRSIRIPAELSEYYGITAEVGEKLKLTGPDEYQSYLEEVDTKSPRHLDAQEKLLNELNVKVGLPSYMVKIEPEIPQGKRRFYVKGPKKYLDLLENLRVIGMNYYRIEREENSYAVSCVFGGFDDISFGRFATAYVNAIRKEKREEEEF